VTARITIDGPFLYLSTSYVNTKRPKPRRLSLSFFLESIAILGAVASRVAPLGSYAGRRRPPGRSIYPPAGSLRRAGVPATPRRFLFGSRLGGASAAFFNPYSWLPWRCTCLYFLPKCRADGVEIHLMMCITAASLHPMMHKIHLLAYDVPRLGAPNDGCSPIGTGAHILITHFPQ
jgi:hypothetical protein